MSKAIAVTTLVVQRPGEAAVEVDFSIGAPKRLSSDEWSCAISLRPLYERLSDARGGSALQSLCLAISLGLELLHGVVEDGGSVSLVGGDAFPFEAYAFGVANRKGSGNDWVDIILLQAAVATGERGEVAFGWSNIEALGGTETYSLESGEQARSDREAVRRTAFTRYIENPDLIRLTLKAQRGEALTDEEALFVSRVRSMDGG